MRKKTISIICCFTFFGGISFAQFNDSTNHYVNLSSIGVVNKTNDRNSWLLNNNLKLALYKKHISMNASAGMIYGEQNNMLTNRDFTAALDFNRYFDSNPTYFWGLATYEKNYSLKITNRIQAGLGAGYNLVDQKKAIITISDGILFERSDLPVTTEGTSLDYHTFRNSFRLKYRFLIRNIITIDGIDFLQHSLSDRKDYIIKSQTNFSLKLMRWLSFTTGATYNKLSKTGRENLLLNFGLTMEKYF